MSIINFEHPIHKVPCYAEYDVDGEVLMFGIVDYDEAVKEHPLAIVKEVAEWCMRSPINCYSKDQANNHLSFLGVRAQFK